MEEKKPPQKNPCPDCTFCQCCSEARCGMCRPPKKKDKESVKPKIHRPLFLKF